MLLRDGIPVLGPGPVQRLHLPEVAAPGPVELVDPEGVPVARVELADPRDGDATLTGRPHWLGTVSTRPFEQLYTAPASVRADAERDGSTSVVVDRPLQAGELDRFGDTRLTLLVLAGPSVEPGAAALSSIRSALTAAAGRADTRVVAVPLTAARATAEPALLETVMRGYGPRAAVRLPATTGDQESTGGLVLFFTGLSGSGKSTVARAVRNGILERDGRTVTLLDGDVVRRNLSAGLGFSPADRETNIRRIGWVAAEIAHHGGFAICSPIAPYDRTRKEVRRMVTERGGTLVLVHIATPVQECERRDRKGLYAKARRGEIPDFTGISAPYESPEDADLVLDTTSRSIEDVRDDVLDLLIRRDLLGVGPVR